MNSDEEIIENYQINEAIWESKTANCSDKATAWRKQLLLLEKLSCNLDEVTHYELIQHHYDKLAASDEESFRAARLRNVKSLLKGFQSTKTFAEANGFPDIDELQSVEPACHGDYESCAHKEITNEQLQILKADFINMIPKESAVSSPSKKQSYESTIPSVTASQVVQKNTMSSFLHNSKPNKPAVQSNNLVNDVPSYQVEASGNNNNKEDLLSEFRTAREELHIQKSKKYAAKTANNQGPVQAPLFNYGLSKKSLGARRTVRSGFVPPIRAEDNASSSNGHVDSNSYHNGIDSAQNMPNGFNPSPPTGTQGLNPSPPLANIDPKMIELITNEIMHNYKPISWDDIAGLEYAKAIIKEAVVYPLLRPDIFTGLRRPPRGILLFGPPGTGKTLIGKCIASQSKSTFFSISASSLTSKWIGDGEKMVRALFAVAAVHQPAVVFIDEIDSLLSQRSETEHESSRRLKNEFLIQLDGAATSEDDRILIVGATNRPQELDEAARRRLVRRLYIPLPEHQARIQILNNLLKTVRNDLSKEGIEEIGHLTDGYSGADMDTLCREASMEPIRSIPPEEMAHFKEDNVRPVNIEDFRTALQNVRPSVSSDDLKQYLEWNKVYGAKR